MSGQQVAQTTGQYITTADRWDRSRDRVAAYGDATGQRAAYALGTLEAELRWRLDTGRAVTRADLRGMLDVIAAAGVTPGASRRE